MTRRLIVISGAALLWVASVASQDAKRPDTSPHVETRVAANGVVLQSLDWGGTGEVVLLLAGLGNDAHIFDTFAPALTDRWHVVGLTRRGFGGSDKPAIGYTTSIRVEDIRGFLDSQHIPKAHLVGHSLAGDEMTLFASRYPERVGKLVFLDAAYNRAGSVAMGLTAPASTDPNRWMILEAIGPPDATRGPMPPGGPPSDVVRVMVAFIKEMNEFRPDFSTIQAPTLALYVVNDRDPATPPQADEETRRRMNTWWTEQLMPWQRARIEEFRQQQPRAEIVEVNNASHFLFLGATQQDTVRGTRDFLSR